MVTEWVAGVIPRLEGKLVDDFAIPRRTQIQIKFSPEKSKAEPDSRFNASELRVIMSNLLANASEAVSDDGLIVVSCRFYKDSLMIAIQDNGCGVPENVQPLLFRNGATFGKSKANGLGLFSARKYIEHYGGNIRLQSAEGQGTLVSIHLKVRQ